ncbi:DUF305 domain-containing protein [Streptomyces sp. TRM68367]|uniref:DUF305 domain-containing protein n=1 Tax=Streptomyces sp. TRM68367 TaxID=2758415 RepID=UPI00165B3FDE|nr:DUF305 domain-containing protein [Streptomyces sp. TRM68367]MBC9725006.1 DUF305 domain-containing protein [Streptomyces sp. TRM68367]
MNPPIPLGRLCAATLMAAGLALVGAPAAVADGDTGFSEKEFLSSAVDHHFGGVHMAEMCVDKATRADLRGLCGRIKDTQSEDITRMRSWLKTWYGTDETPSMPRMSQPMMEMMNKLPSLTGRTFDVEMSRHFVHHHSMFLPRADKCRKQAAHGELRAMCDAMYETQSREIAQFEAVIAGRPVTVDTGHGALATGDTDNRTDGNAGWLAAAGAAAALVVTRLTRRLRRR